MYLLVLSCEMLVLLGGMCSAQLRKEHWSTIKSSRTNEGVSGSVFTYYLMLSDGMSKLHPSTNCR